MHDSKVCFKCEKEKPLSEFYKHKQMFDGHLNKCIVCTKKDVHLYRENNIEYIREYDSKRANNPNRVEARKIYVKTESGKDVRKISNSKYGKSNTIKRRCQNLVNKAIISNKLIKSITCEDCGFNNLKLHGHHDDYTYPLSVRWLCPKCHKTWHNLNGSGLNG